MIETNIAVNLLLEKYSLNKTTILRKKNCKGFPNIEAFDFFKAIISSSSLEEAGTMLSCSSRTIQRILKSLKNYSSSSERGGRIRTYLLNSINLHYCNKCCKIKPLEDAYFYKDNSKYSKYKSNCIDCSKDVFSFYYQNNKEKILTSVYERYQYIKQATPTWANKQELIKFYKNCPVGYHVDHIVPLRGTHVSGLNIVNNLQYLPAKENIRKSNKFTISA